MEIKFDALVIGAAVVEICAAARLAHKGYRTLPVVSIGCVGLHP